MLISYKRGQGSIIIRVKILDSSVSTGAGKTGLAYNTSGLLISTIADNEATATVYSNASSTTETISTLGTFSAPTATKCRFKEVDSTNHKGVYELQFADARFSVSSAKSLLVSISGPTNAAETDFVIPLTDMDPYDSVRAGLTALPNAAANANGGLPILSSSGTTLGYTISTLTTYTGNTPQTGDAYARIGSTGSGLTSLAPAGTALSTATWTSTRAGYLDNLSAGAVMLASSYTAPPSAATISTQVASDLATAHGSGSWATATGFSTHSASDVWAVPTRVLTAGTNIALAKGTGVTGFNDIPAGTQMDLVNAPNATAVTAIQSGLATASALTSLAAKFTGITLLARWLGLLAGKTADSTTLAELQSTVAGASFDNTIDSLQAVRDRGDAAWTGGGGSSTVIVTPVSSTIASRVESTLIEAYFEEEGWTIGPVVLTNSDGDAVSLASYDGDLTFVAEDSSGVDVWSTADVVISGDDDNQFSVIGNSALTTTAPRDLKWALRAIRTGLNVVLARGTLRINQAASEDPAE